MARNRKVAVAASMAAMALLVAACSSGGTPTTTPDPTTDSTDSPSESQEPVEPVTLRWWHNGTGEPLNGLWASVAKEFEAANPGVTVEVQGFQNEELQRTLIPNALTSGDAPDIFQAWGGGEIRDQVAGGHLKDLTGLVDDELAAIGPKAGGWQLEGKTYALPFTFGISGFWYNKDLFAQAGITEPPTTLDGLYDAIEKLKGIGTAPIAVGAGSGWPAAHYWYHFALKSCSPEALSAAQASLNFDDPCFVKAGELLQEFIASEPFNEGFLATSAQEGAGSSAGLVATGNAAMELMGHWNAGVMGGILRDETGDENATPPDFLGWFNFPAIEGAAGDPTAALGGGDGFAVSKDAPDAAVDLLKYILSPEVQKRFGESGAGIPTVDAAQDSITDANLNLVQQGMDSASFIQLWLDTAYGGVVGTAMNENIVNMFGGQGTPQGIVDAMKAAAGTL
ncbi:MAG: extracellular solute-binding protein [Actinomycetota bacterium]|nr:extracellular solute-binding protein [Actinomycetota bacterium]